MQIPGYWVPHIIRAPPLTDAHRMQRHRQYMKAFHSSAVCQALHLLLISASIRALARRRRGESNFKYVMRWDAYLCSRLSRRGAA